MGLNLEMRAMASREDELAAAIANHALSLLPPGISVSFRDDLDGKIVAIGIRLTQNIRVSKEAMMFESRGNDMAAIIGHDLAMLFKEQVVKLAALMCGAREEKNA